MKKQWGWLLLLGLTACGQPLEIAPEVALKQQSDAAFQQQVQLLQAEQVKVSATAAAAGGAGPAVLHLDVLNPKNQPVPPDSLKHRMRKLAHLLVANLASPARYQVVNAQAIFKPGRFSKDKNTSSQAFIYPIASLK